MDLETIALACVYQEETYVPLYRPPSKPRIFVPRALPRGKVRWILKDGKEVEIEK